MKILHIINSLGNGGAEKVLTDFASNSTYDNKIITLYNDYHYEHLLKKKNILIHKINLSKNNILNSFKSIFSIISLVKKDKPDIIVSWMYQSCIISFFFKFLGIDIVWNIRHSNFKFKETKILTLISVLICGIFSWFIPKKIIYCSKNSIKNHSFFLFNNFKKLYIPNGVDEKKFNFNLNYKNNLLNKFVIENNFIIGNIARYHKQKDHKTFLKSLNLLKNKNIEFKVIMIGSNIDHKNKELIDLINLYELSDKILLLGSITDVDKYYSLFDILIMSSSHGEGFPNVLIEAMASKIPVVATNVGDSSIILGGDKNYIVDVYDYKQISEKIYSMYLLKKNDKANFEKIGISNRNRVLKSYTLPKMIKNYETFFESLIS